MRGRETVTKLTVVILALLAAQVHAQRQTIPEALAQGSTGRFRTTPSGQAPTMDEIIQNTHLIVRGTVGEPQSYMSEDMLDVHTDYPILNPMVLYAADVLEASRPGLPKITATQLGGTVQINGLTFTQTEDGLPALQPGAEVLLLLQRVGSKYHIAGTFYGAFGISGGKLAPLTRKAGFAEEYRGLPTDQAAAHIVDKIRTLR